LQIRLCIFQIYEEIAGKKEALPLTQQAQNNLLEKVKKLLETNENNW